MKVWKNGSYFSSDSILVIMNSSLYFHAWRVNRAKLKYAFINVIRDPIDHLVSQWYFSQSGTPFSKDSDSRKTNKNIKSIDLCVADQDEFCKNGGSWERDEIFNSQSHYETTLSDQIKTILFSRVREWYRIFVVAEKSVFRRVKNHWSAL